MATAGLPDGAADKVLSKVDALLAKHRGPGASRADTASLPTLTEVAGPQPEQPEAQDIPTLTDIVAEPPPLFAQPRPDKSAAPVQQSPKATAGADVEPAPVPSASGSVITRVQAQNLEHELYLKLRKNLDQHISGVIENQFMPQIGAALDQAMQRVARDLQTHMHELVRSSVEQTLQLQMKSLQLAHQVAPAETAAGVEPQRSGIMHDFSVRPAMELAKSFEPDAIERRWYPVWEQAGYFKAGCEAGKPSYCILLPPPNVTGTLHMGHAFQHTLMDALIRYHRMLGDNTLWQPGTDHAGIATQIVVERQLEAQNLSRREMGRYQFVERVWRWKEESGFTISRQMRRLGASCDWSRERFPMEEGLSRTVTEGFVRLHREGLIYRGKRLVNWDPVLQTAVSDLEVVSEEEDGSLWNIRYPFEDGSGHVVVATTRPETMLGDAAVAVHPDDARYSSLIGKTLRLPLAERLIPVVADPYVDPAFGTGCLKITPAHDFNDYHVGQRHGLAPISIFTLDAKLNDNAPAAYRGLDRFEARTRIVADLQAQGLLA